MKYWICLADSKCVLITHTRTYTNKERHPKRDDKLTKRKRKMISLCGKQNLNPLEEF